MNALGWCFAFVFGSLIGAPAFFIGFAFYYARIGFTLGGIVASVLDENKRDA